VPFHSKRVHDSLPNSSGLPRRLMINCHNPKSRNPAEDPDRRSGLTRQHAQDLEARKCA
jgi:hypothetical protein